MGRNIKEGLSFFPIDVDFFEDEKVQFVSAKFGIKGDGIIIRLLCKIYRNGYSMKFDDDVALLFCRSVGDINTVGLVKEVVSELLKRGFFNEAIFKRFGILTSNGIQKRYERICTDAKRKDWKIDENIYLLGSKPVFTPEEKPFTPEESTQSKVKESKVKESKEDSPPDGDVQKFDFKKEMIKKGFDKILVEDWIKIKKLKRLGATETIFLDFIDEIKKLPNVDKNIQLKMAVTKSWGGYKSHWYENEINNNNKNYNNGNSTSRPNNSKSSGAYEAIERLKEHIAISGLNEI